MSGIEAKSGPFVSVIVPAHNAEATLPETLESVLASTYRDIEIIVVDDGSTDGTAAIVDGFSSRDERLRMHRKPNGGVSAAFNAGLALARGVYVARLDSDDIWHPTKIEKQVDVAQGDAECAFVYCFVRYIDGGSRVVRDIAPQCFPPRSLCRGFYENIVGGNSSALMRHDVVASLGGYDETLTSWEDLLLQLRISARWTIAFVPEYLVGYRVRPGSLSSDPGNMLSSWLDARDRLERLFPQVPRRVHGWAHGRRCGELAASFAWRRRYGTSVKLLGQALRHDPEWTLEFLRYRLGRLRRDPRSDCEATPLFLECSPTEQVRLDPYDSGAEGRRLHLLHEKRVRILADLDEKLAAARGGA